MIAAVPPLRRQFVVPAGVLSDYYLSRAPVDAEGLSSFVLVHCVDRARRAVSSIRPVSPDARPVAVAFSSSLVSPFTSLCVFTARCRPFTAHRPSSCGARPAGPLQFICCFDRAAIATFPINKRGKRTNDQ